MASQNQDGNQEIQRALENLQNLGALKTLFWNTLNYQRVNQKISPQNLSDAVTNEIEGELLLLAVAGNNNPFYVIYTCLKSENISRQSERLVVNHFHQKYPYALFVFSNQSQSRWHFINVKYDENAHNTSQQQILRRITVGDREQLRTAIERISLLDLETLPDKSPLSIQARIDEAFDVEAVTKEFFKEYDRIFKELEKKIKGINDENKKRLFTQKLFNRLLFIAFIEKKGWLEFQENTDYLSALWRDYNRRKGQKAKEANFYKDRLSQFFFKGLNTPEEKREELKDLIGSVPFLNGGLFEQEEDDKNPNIIIPDSCIDSILHDLFQRFNFTVTESTPLDVEVAVDPEMLGKVFEELVTGRHDTGSYYTPKAIVSFMCREALKGYLKTTFPKESDDGVAKFVDEHNPDKLIHREDVLDALRRVRCCDLACGSGAYLLGMLHELLDLRQCLFENYQLGSNIIYERKLEIIKNNLYGVDNNDLAVNIARLRLWLGC
jgi:hypothetical protein